MHMKKIWKFIFIQSKRYNGLQYHMLKDNLKTEQFIINELGQFLKKEMNYRELETVEYRINHRESI